MEFHSDNPEQYAQIWFYVTLGLVALFGLMALTLVYRN
jgi:hypothetical protein